VGGERYSERPPIRFLHLEHSRQCPEAATRVSRGEYYDKNSGNLTCKSISLSEIAGGRPVALSWNASNIAYTTAKHT
jgi:hypothetical protein